MRGLLGVENQAAIGRQGSDNDAGDMSTPKRPGDGKFSFKFRVDSFFALRTVRLEMRCVALSEIVLGFLFRSLRRLRPDLAGSENKLAYQGRSLEPAAPTVSLCLLLFLRPRREIFFRVFSIWKAGAASWS